MFSRCLVFRATGRVCVVIALVTSLLTGCSEDPGLQERLNRLQAEMQEKDRQLQEAQLTVEKSRAELKAARAVNASKPAVTPPATPQFLTRTQVEESYAAASSAMQKRIGAEHRNYSLENCTEFPVMMPTDEFPYHSKIDLIFRSDSGHAVRLEFPVSADVAGRWIFPNAVDVAAALADNRAADPTPNPTDAARSTPGNGTPPPASRTSPTGSPSLVPGQSATETHVIDWGGERSMNRDRPPPSPSLPTPTGGKSPSATMPSNQDVTIHWQ